MNGMFNSISWTSLAVAFLCAILNGNAGFWPGGKPGPHLGSGELRADLAPQFAKPARKQIAFGEAEFGTSSNRVWLVSRSHGEQ